MVTTSIIIAACIYAAYNAVALAFFGVPESLSNTYYLYQDKCNKGWLFCAMMYLVVAFMMPTWITMSEGSDFQFLSFLAPVGIMFVGTAPRFKDSMMENGGSIAALGTICMYTTDSTGRKAILTGWLASQSDMLLEDWVVVE